MSLEAEVGNNSNLHDEEVRVCTAADLIAACVEGRGDEVVRILEVDLKLLRVGDLNGDTVFHLLVSGGYVEPLLQLFMFMIAKNPKLLKEVANQKNAQGATPLHFAIKNDYMWILNLLEMVELYGETEEEKTQLHKKLLDALCNTLNRFKNKDKQEIVDSDFEALWSVLKIDTEKQSRAIVEYIKNKENILEKLGFNPNLLKYKDYDGFTILHVLASNAELDAVTQVVGHLGTTSRTKSLLLEGDNRCGWTPLHLAVIKKNMELSRYLVELAPEAAYQVDNNGESPLYVAVNKGHDELVNHMLQVMPEASMSAATRSSLLSPNKASLVHLVIRLGNLSMLKMILESIPSLIDSLDEKGWKPLSYAAFKGYHDGVHYLLNEFPESVKKFDRDGSLPIHKAVNGGHVSIIKTFISIHPKTLYFLDIKGRNVLQIAAKYRKHDILSYLRDEVNGVEKLYDLKDNDGKTFAYYAPRND